MMEEINNGIIKAIGWLFLLFLCVLIFIYGFFVSKWLINWHIVPYFKLPDVTIWQVVGLSSVIASFKSIVVIRAAQKIMKSDDESMALTYERAITVFFILSLILLFGWIAK
jgi:hypothetical protein